MPSPAKLAETTRIYTRPIDDDMQRAVDGLSADD
jgi:hypothetical protein